MASASLVYPRLRPAFPNNHGDFCPRIPAELRVRGVNRIEASRPMALPVRSSSTKEEETEPLVLRAAVSAVTELLRVFNKGRWGKFGPINSPNGQSTSTVESQPEVVNELKIASQDIVGTLRSDFADYYFLTGNFTDGLYAENCFYADPTVQFSGRDLYKRNLKLLVPFYEDPSLVLDDIQEVGDGESKFIQAFWKLRVYLKLPWKPFIAVDGSTKYELDANTQIMRHVESWNITGVEAIGQLFKPSDRAFWRRSSSG